MTLARRSIMNDSAKAPVALPGTRPSPSDDEAAASRHVREMFSGIAPRYDVLNHVLSLRLDVVWRKRLARRFRSVLAQPNVRALDLCCGTGDLTLALAAVADRAGGRFDTQLIGADFAHPMLVRAGEKAKTQPHGRTLRFIEADALRLPFADRTFDLVTTAFGFRNLANYRAGLLELKRIVRVGGSVAILEFSEPRSAIFGELFRFYFHRVLPRLGGMISGNSGAYAYLPRSVRRFPAATELAELMREAGFSAVKFERWTGGIVTMHVGRR
jgi:demethylmenaquinone methyltransferase / 2-methoxy-6-polyprenyl-1,4-benzoquinol methylase